MWSALFICLSLMAAEPAETIRNILIEQSDAWNRGDIPAFMRAYENSPDTTYAGAAGVTKGYAKVLARYQQKYSTRELMGTLRFSSLDIRMLSADYATVTGQFHLTRASQAGGDASGWFTLVLRKTSAGWKIIHDHTSSS